MTKIGIDAHSIGSHQSGCETYITNLLEGLATADSPYEFVPFFTHAEEAASWRQKHENLHVVLLRMSQPLIRTYISIPWSARRLGIDILHTQFVGPLALSSKMVVTVHDIAYEHYPEFFTKRQVLQFKSTIPQTIRRAKKVLTISEYSKRDIIETYGIPEEKVVVTYDGVSEEFKPLNNVGKKNKTTQKYGLDVPYFLAVGELQPRKNLNRLVMAYERLRNARPEIKHKLVIAGKKAWKSDPVMDLVARSRWLEDIIFTGYVPADDLPALYASATAFVYPSIFEGFGLPPLEAMACGTPVITSNRTALPEVVGEAGIMVEPLNVDEIAAAMASLALEPGMAKQLGIAGIKRASRFRWTDCVAKTLNVYDEVLAGA